MPCASSMTLGPDSPSRTVGTSAIRSAAQASTAAPPNTSPTPIASTRTPAARRSSSAASARASANSAGFASCRRTPPDAQSRSTAAGRSASAILKRVRNDSAWLAPALPPRKRSSCAAMSTGAAPIVARAITTPSSSCAVMPQRARCGEGRGAESVVSTAATLPGSAIAVMRSRGASGRSAVETAPCDATAQHMSMLLVKEGRHGRI